MFNTRLKNNFVIIDPTKSVGISIRSGGTDTQIDGKDWEIEQFTTDDIKSLVTTVTTKDLLVILNDTAFRSLCGTSFTNYLKNLLSGEDSPLIQQQLLRRHDIDDLTKDMTEEEKEKERQILNLNRVRLD